MKKYFKLLVFSLLFFIVFSFNVKANSASSEVFSYDWNTSSRVFSGKLEDEKSEGQVYYKYGYINYSIENNGSFFDTLLTKYDIKGNILNKSTLKNTVLYDVVLCGDNIYALERTYSNSIFSYYIVVIDNNLNVSDRYNIDKQYISNYDQYSNSYGFNLINVDDKGDILYYSLKDKAAYYVGKSGLTKATNEDVVKKYFPFVQRLTSTSQIEDYLGYDSDDGVEVVTGALGRYINILLDAEGIDDGTTLPEKGKNLMGGVIKIFVDNNEYRYTYGDYFYILEPQIVGDYIVALAVKTLDSSKSEVIVVDMKGNIVQKINSSDTYAMVTGKDKSFMVNSITQDTSCSTGSTSCYKAKSEVYYIPLNVETKVTGNGEINVVESTRYGEEVAFVVTPDEGYVLDSVKVTDELGNVVTFTDYTFTMPNANVTIEVEFVEKTNDVEDTDKEEKEESKEEVKGEEFENPNTYDIAIPILVVISGILVYFIVKKVKFVKWLNS